MMDLRTLPIFANPASSIAQAIAAGCAITGIKPGSGRERVGSAEGARRRACGCSSRAPVKSIRTGPSAGLSLRARRLDASEPVRNATFDPARLCVVSGTSASTSSSSTPSIVAFSAAAEINSICGAGFAASSNSRTSLASSESPPTRATRERVVFSANLVLRFLRRLGMRPQSPAYTAANADRDADAHVADRQHQQHRLREIPHQENEHAHQNNRERRARMRETQILEAGITPSAHHQE